MKWIFILVLLLVSGWNWETHTAFVDSVYYSLDEGRREQLSLELLEEGSIAPDKEFRDFVRHSYPHAIGQAELWLVEARDAVVRGDYDTASYAFGVVSHYVSDSFSSPHGVSGEEYFLHKAFEDQASVVYDVVACEEFNVNVDKSILRGSYEGNYWDEWVTTRDERLVRNGVVGASKVVTALGMDVFGSTCSSFSTFVVVQLFDRGDVLVVGMLSLCMISLGWSVWRDLKND
jgi:hypothetical protein